MATKKTVENPEFLYLSLGDIIIEEQIRSSIDTESESFKALMESIAGAHVAPSTGKATTHFAGAPATPSRS